MTTNEITYTAQIADEDGTVEVDIRSCRAERLQALQVEAGAAGDSALVEAIESVLAGR